MTLPRKSGIILARGGHWTGPKLSARQYGWRCEYAIGSFGEPQYHAYGATVAEARAALGVKIAEDQR